MAMKPGTADRAVDQTRKKWPPDGGHFKIPVRLRLETYSLKRRHDNLLALRP